MNRTTVLIAVLVCAAAALGQAPAPTFDGAKWIWCAPGATQTPDTYGGGPVFFRATVDLPAGQVKSAEIIMTADNLFALHINGKGVGESEPDNSSWGKPRRFDVAGLLTPGKNVIAVEGVNTIPGPAGLICKLVVQLADGQQVVLVTDKTWRCSEKEEKNWNQPAFEDKAWRSAYAISDYGSPPWNKVAVRSAAMKPAPVSGKIHKMGQQAALGADPTSSGPSQAVVESIPPADYAWPEALVFVGDDCSLYRPYHGTGTSMDSLSVTIFNPRNARAFPEHDLPAPMKVGHKLYGLKPARPGTTPRVLLDAGKGAIGSPSASFDGKSIYLSMVREGEGFFHIYRLPADGGEPQRLTRGPFHDIDPAELPDGRLVFVSTRAGTFEEYHNPPSRALFVMNADGSDIHPISPTFIFDNEPEVMADGRIIFIRSDNFFDRGKGGDVPARDSSRRNRGLHGIRAVSGAGIWRAAAGVYLREPSAAGGWTRGVRLRVGDHDCAAGAGAARVAASWGAGGGCGGRGGWQVDQHGGAAGDDRGDGGKAEAAGAGPVL